MMGSIGRVLVGVTAVALLGAPAPASAAEAAVSIDRAGRDGNVASVAGSASADEVAVAIDRRGLDPAGVEYAAAVLPGDDGAWSAELDATGIRHTLAAYARVCVGEDCTYATRDLGAIRTVVAVIESHGTNPYHEFFNQGGSLYGDQAPSSVTPEVLEEFGIGEEHVISLTRTGSFAQDYAQDRPQFEAIERGQPYWFEGTNVIGVSLSGSDGNRLRPDAGGTHAVGTTAAVLTANPEAIVVIVESPFAPLGVPGWGTAPQGEAWSFSDPSVDLVSTSYGPPQSPPFGYHLTDSYRGVVERGKIHTGASENSPALSPVDATSGPWWTIGISGYREGGSEGRAPQSGSLPDMLANWTQTLPYCKGCTQGTSTVNGTSFATPRTAGTLSTILLEARRAAGHTGGIRSPEDEAPVMVDGDGLRLANWDLRRALEEAAWYPGLDDWSPSADPPVIDAAPWATAGWGVVTPDPERRVVEETLAHLGVAGEPTRHKPAEACTFMTANMEARRAWWDQVAPFSQSGGTTEYPYVSCET